MSGRLKVWVLAASTGGIDAVSRFMKLVPRRADLALVYVQHLDPLQHPQLLRIVERHSNWPARSVDYGAELKGGWVTIPSAEERFDIGDDGLMGVVDGEGWQPPYRPNIDEVAGNIGREYRDRSGIIVFSGMGKDGARGAEAIHRSGGRAWVQNPTTCAALSMPQETLRLLPGAFSGDVEELAREFMKQVLESDR